MSLLLCALAWTPFYLDSSMYMTCWWTSLCYHVCSARIVSKQLREQLFFIVWFVFDCSAQLNIKQVCRIGVGVVYWSRRWVASGRIKRWIRFEPSLQTCSPTASRKLCFGESVLDILSRSTSAKPVLNFWRRLLEFVFRLRFCICKSKKGKNKLPRRGKVTPTTWSCTYNFAVVLTPMRL